MKLRKMIVYVVTFLYREDILYQKIFKDYVELEKYVCETVKSDDSLLTAYVDDIFDENSVNQTLTKILKQMKTNINNYDLLLPYRIYVTENEI